MKGIKKSQLSNFLQQVSAKYSLYVPAQVDGVTRFQKYSSEREPFLTANTQLSPKELFFPQTEQLYCYETHKQEVKVEELAASSEPQVLFGVRPCDMQAIGVLDDVFLGKGYEDVYYRAKRANTLIIALACSQAEATCFCDSMGVDPAFAPQADLMMYETEDGYLIEALSDQGKDFLQEFSSALEELRSEKPQAPACELKAETDGLVEKLQKMFEHSVWAELSRKCINCGTCTYLCPTCHCFDIESKTRGGKEVKFRCWDSCMYKEYTLMAGGHNPRPTKKERVRQRFLHKLQYMPERYGKWGCVGCGRCIDKCPVNLDITKVIRELREVEA
ncbi:MAG TPA: hypothetical protein GXZ50_10030 [Clostridia bacterium]|nr:hypothetical protein [Clostridia bacterium]